MKCSGVLHRELQQGPTVPHAPTNEQKVAGFTLNSAPLGRVMLLYSVWGEVLCPQT